VANTRAANALFDPRSRNVAEMLKRWGMTFRREITRSSFLVTNRCDRRTSTFPSRRTDATKLVHLHGLPGPEYSRWADMRPAATIPSKPIYTTDESSQVNQLRGGFSRCVEADSSTDAEKRTSTRFADPRCSGLLRIREVWANHRPAHTPSDISRVKVAKTGMTTLRRWDGHGDVGDVDPNMDFLFPSGFSG